MGALALLAVTAVLSVPATAAAESPGCKPADAWPIAKRAWQRVSGPRGSERRRYREVKRCADPKRTRRKWRHAKQRFSGLRAEKREVRALLVYAGPRKRWAIPAAIVACESGYSWSAYNPSGAVGPYQLLGKGAAFPVVSQADKREHHLIAGHLWAGGAGRSHWVC